MDVSSIRGGTTLITVNFYFDREIRKFTLITLDLWYY